MSEPIQFEIPEEFQVCAFKGSFFPPRFRSSNDAHLFMECMIYKRAFPPDKWIHPFETKNGHVMISQEYKDAPYECNVIPTPTVINQ